MVQTAILQLGSIGLNSAKLDYYLRIASSQNVELLMLGEYIVSSFFKELESMSQTMIKEQSSHQIASLKSLAKEYNMVLVAPIIQVKSSKIYKTIARVMPNGKTFYYHQQILMDYSHWNEAKFFDNEVKELQDIHSFTYKGMKFAIISGFELHFDNFWLQVNEKKIDAVLLPTSSTFGSNNRWRQLCQMRAFTNNCYVLRANRIGEYKSKDGPWVFYGDSLAISPNGDIEQFLTDKEELMVATLSKEEVKLARKDWHFNQLLQKRKS